MLFLAVLKKTLIGPLETKLGEFVNWSIGMVSGVMSWLFMPSSPILAEISPVMLDADWWVRFAVAVMMALITLISLIKAIASVLPRRSR